MKEINYKISRESKFRPNYEKPTGNISIIYLKKLKMLTSTQQYSTVWRDGLLADIFVIFSLSNHQWWTTIKVYSLKILVNSQYTCYYYVVLIFRCDLFRYKYQSIFYQKEKKKGKQKEVRNKFIYY